MNSAAGASKMNSNIAHRAAAHAADGLPVTLGGTGSALVCWGLHISDVAVIFSALAAVAGVLLQFYVAMRRLRILEVEVNKSKDRADIAATVAVAGAAATREVAKRVADVESKLDS